ncbi:hypothetical protein PIB30_060169 [Stylosanthes scabra]|uniref:Uncharacterized protein n=1 Tax=Stylosanthes scabra TaxID=79078 RepID=A0ABU6ZJ65_9FABA|nr:hypothetical protein [Stylosanthes scabra]
MFSAPILTRVQLVLMKTMLEEYFYAGEVHPEAVKDDMFNFFRTSFNQERDRRHWEKAIMGQMLLISFRVGWHLRHRGKTQIKE